MYQNGHAVNENIKNKILATFSMQELESESREDLLFQISRVVFQSVLLRVVTMLDEEDQLVYNQMIQRDAGIDELTIFFMKTIPPFESIVLEEINTLANVLKKENPEAMKKFQSDKKIEDLRAVLLEKFNNN